jgi:cobalt-zinc-cadmium efflux system outer membrane protein
MKCPTLRHAFGFLLAAVILAVFGPDYGRAQQNGGASSFSSAPGASVQQPRRERLRIPDDLPGADVPPLRLPPITPATQKEREAAIKKLFPPLPPLGPPLEARLGPDGQPLSLGALQHMAQEGNPALRQAAHDIEAARGAAVQAGLYPNPILGYEADTINQDATAGQQGGFIQQTIKTAGKLKLAQAAASIDVLNAQLALRRTQIEVASQVRSNYFAVLVAQETFKAAYALTTFTDEAYGIWTDQVFAQQAAPYEPLQLRVLSFQARGYLVQARNRYDAAWKQLAASLGNPSMPPTQLAGRVDSPAPVFRYQDVLDRINSRHTDVLSAANSVLKERYVLRLAQVTPIPDVHLQLALQHDYTTTPNHFTQNVQIGLPVPIFDRNQGEIHRAEAALARAELEGSRVRNDLAARLAGAFERYENNRKLLEYYKNHMLPDQVMAFRGLYQQYELQTEKVNFTALLQGQQILGQTVTAYLTVLGDLWTSVVDVANVSQIDDLFAFGQTETPPALDTLEALLQMPCNPPKTKVLRQALETGGPPSLPPIDMQPPGLPDKKP